MNSNVNIIKSIKNKLLDFSILFLLIELMKFINSIFLFTLAIFYSFLIHIKTFFINLSNKNFFSKNFDEFIELNSSFWKKNNKNYTNNKNNKNILITNFVHQPVYTYTESLISKYIQNFHGYNIFGLIDYIDKFGKKLIKSFNIDNFFYYPNISIFQRFFYLFQAFRIINNLKNVDQFINFSKGEVNFGRCVYDHLIRNTETATFSKINFKFYFFLSEALFCNNFCVNFFSKNKFEYMTMSETQFLPSNIIFQHALINKIKVISRVGGPKNIGITLFNSIKDKHNSNVKIKKSFIEKLYAKDKKFFSNKGLDEITKIFNNQMRHYDKNSEKNFLKKNNLDTNDLYNFLNWNKSKKICVIFGHNLYDGNYANSSRIFRDNFTWLRETLFFIKNLKPEINWLYKEHPSEYGSKFRDARNSIKEFNDIIKVNENIKIFPKNFNSMLLKDIANCALTSQGSVGIEYPCFGIPVITAGDSFYDDLGFSYNPKNKDQYFNLITNMSNIISKKLSIDEIDLARISFYFSNKATKMDHPLLYESNITKQIDFNFFFDQHIDLISKYKEGEDVFKKCFQIQLASNDRHLTIV